MLTATEQARFITLRNSKDPINWLVAADMCEEVGDETAAAKLRLRHTWYQQVETLLEAEAHSYTGHVGVKYVLRSDHNQVDGIPTPYFHIRAHRWRKTVTVTLRHADVGRPEEEKLKLMAPLYDSRGYRWSWELRLTTLRDPIKLKDRVLKIVERLEKEVEEPGRHLT